MKLTKKFVVAISVAVVFNLLLLTPSSAIAQQGDHWLASHSNSDAAPALKILPPDQQYAGLTYGEWAGKWWQWAALLPATNHPLFDTADCANGQSGPVWFLGGKFCASVNPNCHPEFAQRTCTIPTGKALLIPLINTEDSFIEDVPGATEAGMRDFTKWVMDQADNLSLSIDGIPVPHLDRHRICTRGTTCLPMESPLSTYRLASHDNIWAAAGILLNAGTEPMPDGLSSESVGDGYYVLVEPLNLGKHNITFHAELPSFNYKLDVTYDLTVMK